MTPEVTLSSRMTIFWKIISGLWILGFILMTAIVWMSDDVPPGIKWLQLTLLIVGSIAVGWGCIRLKRVRVVGRDLYVSNYLKEIVVPLRSLEKVTENRWTNPRQITIHLRDDTVFGRKFTFMPKSHMMVPWWSHPIVGELRRIADAAVAEKRV